MPGAMTSQSQAPWDLFWEVLRMRMEVKGHSKKSGQMRQTMINGFQILKSETICLL